MAKKKSELEELGLDKKTLDKIYVQAKIKATPYDYSLKDRVVLEASDSYSKTVNVFNQENKVERTILTRLGVDNLAEEELRYALFNMDPVRREYVFPNLNWYSDYELRDLLSVLLKSDLGFMYKHNNMVINEAMLTEAAKRLGVKAAEALIGLYTRLYAKDSIIPQLALTLWESAKGLSLDAVANLAFVREAMENGKGYVPDTDLENPLGQTLSQLFYIRAMDPNDCDSTLYPGHPKWSHLYSELLRQNVFESAMYMCEIYRAFNSMDPTDREALAPLLETSLCTLIDAKYDVNEAKFTSPDFDAFCGEPAASRFEKIQTYAYAQLSKNFPDVLTWNGTSVANHATDFQEPIFAICNDLHCKAWEDFRVKNFALMLQMCQEKGIDISDLREAADGGEVSGAGGGSGNGSEGDQDFGDMRMGTKYAPSEQAESGNPGEKAQSNSTPKLETMSNLIKSCDSKYTIDVQTVVNNKAYKDAYLKLLKPIEFITKELTKQIRAIKTYNFGGKNAGKSRGKLDSHTMYRYKTDPNVFYDTTYKIREMDLAFGIILDQSGSMYGDGMYNGMISLIMLHHVLTSLRINHAIVGHNSRNFNSVSIKKYVAFNEDAAHTLEVPYMLANLHSGGGNCDSGALNYMEQYIKRTRNKDKIVLIFSDGEPSECEESDLHKQIRKMEREGIHVIGLGIDFENIKHYYPDHANGRSLSEMVSILVDVLKRYVLDKKS